MFKLIDALISKQGFVLESWDDRYSKGVWVAWHCPFALCIMSLLVNAASLFSALPGSTIADDELFA